MGERAERDAGEITMKAKRKPDGSMCPICFGIGRKSARYPSALCNECQRALVDLSGNNVELFNVDISGGLAIQTSDGATALKPEMMPLFCRGVECRAREHRFGGVVVQPLDAWQS
jgi:hypothetical protein